MMAADSRRRIQKEDLVSKEVRKPTSKSPVASSTSKSPYLKVKTMLTDAEDGLKNSNSFQRIQNPLFNRQGPLLIKEVSENSPKKIQYVEGKGKAIDETLNLVTPNSFKSKAYPSDMNASTSGMKLFVNRFGNSNAISGPSCSEIENHLLPAELSGGFPAVSFPAAFQRFLTAYFLQNFPATFRRITGGFSQIPPEKAAGNV
ncbi:hypothetical protein MA16_Dca011476 [Dendrobium catenatum]|uniref:Uncharacterized protein n=1 Tax=Dendrobium catenatum TaxID=906689 RepID=A0A2I0VFN0_9ASPA|nr:hypothetical protein MA16_Dca011476 [Dendrobium catenatum]